MADDLAHIHRFGRQRQPAGLDARDIEDFVNQVQQIFAAPQNLVDALRLSFGEFLGGHQLGETENRVERRPEVVAHAREKIALGAVRALGFLLRQPHGSLGLGELGGEPVDLGFGPRVLDAPLGLANRAIDR